jgi:hypothetical protein
MWKYDVVARHHGEAANVFGLINEQNTKWPSRSLDLILRSDGMRVCNPDRSPVGINRCDAAPTPTGFAEIVSDDFPVLHAGRILPLLISTQQ